jgi:RimJ/RimL family protein N-acetyltransferase
MGGTQATNSRAIAFYEKFGFIKYGGYQTEVFNHDMRLEISDERL